MGKYGRTPTQCHDVMTCESNASDRDMLRRPSYLSPSPLVANDEPPTKVCRNASSVFGPRLVLPVPNRVKCGKKQVGRYCGCATNAFAASETSLAGRYLLNCSVPAGSLYLLKFLYTARACAYSKSLFVFSHEKSTPSRSPVYSFVGSIPCVITLLFRTPWPVRPVCTTTALLFGAGAFHSNGSLLTVRRL